MSTLEYGYVIKIVSSDRDSTYDGKYFFVERLYDDSLVLVSDKEIITLDITDQELNNKRIDKFIIVHKAKEGFISQNKLFVGHLIEIEFEEGMINGKIINIKDQTLEVDAEIRIGTGEQKVGEQPETEIVKLYIPLDRGLPKQILSIKPIYKEKKLAAMELPDPDIQDGPKDDLEDGLLNIIEEEVDDTQFYYSIDQQKNDFLENLLMYIPVEQRTPKKLKEINKMIQRYVELREKYSTFSDNIYVNHLHIEQILASTLSFENKLYVPVTKGIYIKLSDPSNFEGNKENFFKETDIHDEWLNEIGQLKENAPFNKALQLLDNFDNLIYNSKLNPNQIKYKPNKTELAYIIGINDYPLMVSNQYVVDSFIENPTFFTEYSKAYLSRSFLLKKSELSLNPYYPSIYGISNGFFCQNKDIRIIYKNQEDTFEKYVKKMIPSMKEFMECINKPIVNMMDVLNELNILEINELNTSNYLLLNEIIKKNIHRIKQNFIKTRPSYLTKPSKDSIVENQIIMDIFSEYENLSKIPQLKKYYSTSEIFKMGEIDLYRLLTFQYGIKNSGLNETTDAEIETIIEEIRQEKDNPLDKQINKIYFTSEEKDRDNFKPIIIRDIQIEGDYISATELLHRELVQSKKTTKSLDHFKDSIDELIENGLNYQPKFGIPATFKIIKEFIIKNKIVKGDIAILNDTKYVWDNEKWVEYKEAPSKKLVTVKGNIETDTAQKEQMYNERILEIIKNIETDKIKVKDLKHFYNEENKKEMKSMIKLLVKQNIFQGLKYNQEKIFLEKIEAGERVGIIESQHEKLRDKILQVYELDIKYKALQLFIERYCKKGREEFWFYCIDTGVKILPTFFNKLATAYLITNNYEDVLEKICLTQGALSDSGDKWVDKYSGYIIKNIEFDYDEGYTESGFKNITRGTIENDEIPMREEDPIMNSIKVLIKYSGLSDIGDDIEWIYSHVMRSHQKALRELKKASKSVSSLYVVAIISVVLVYTQSLAKLSFIKAFPNCKASFIGYPLSEGTSGIKYFCCIVNKMEKPDLPFSSVKKIKTEELEELVINFIKNFVITNVEIEDKLNERRKYKVEEEVSYYTPWTLFLPRLKQIRPVVFEDIGQSNEDKMYYISFIIQHKINTFISKQPPILINHNQVPFLVNTCCNEDNDTHHYFMIKDPSIVDDLTEIRRISKLNKIIQKKLKHPIMYSYENTKKVSIPISTSLDEVTLFTGLIQLLNFDNAAPIPITLTKFGIKKPEHYNKNDNLQLKIRKLKEHGYDITEQMLYEMLQSSATIIKMITKTEKIDDDINDPLMGYFDTKEIKNKAFEMMRQKKQICDKYTGKNKDYEPVLIMDFKKEKRSYTVPIEIEHFTYMYQVLYNKIESLINFAEMIISRKTHTDMVSCKHWKLSQYHYNDIEDCVKSYYNGIISSFTNKELADALLKLPLDKYKLMLKLRIKDPETKYLVYHYIFISIYEMYLSSKVASVKIYLDSVTKLFAKENKRALDFDLKTIKYEIKLSKKSEAEIKTTYLGQLQKDERASENVMKNLKLGKWGVGLQKSMFEYDKDTYLQDKTAAAQVIELMGDDSLEDKANAPQDEYGAFMAEDDDYQEGFDGDELY